MAGEFGTGFVRALTTRGSGHPTWLSVATADHLGAVWPPDLNLSQWPTTDHHHAVDPVSLTCDALGEQARRNQQSRPHRATRNAALLDQCRCEAHTEDCSAPTRERVRRRSSGWP